MSPILEEDNKALSKKETPQTNGQMTPTDHLNQHQNPINVQISGFVRENRDAQSLQHQHHAVGLMQPAGIKLHEQ